MDIARSTQAAERREKELLVWDQIRRTEEELMEMGAMEHALLQSDSVGVHWTASPAAEPSKIVA